MHRQIYRRASQVLYQRLLDRVKNYQLSHIDHSSQVRKHVRAESCDPAAGVDDERAAHSYMLDEIA